MTSVTIALITIIVSFAISAGLTPLVIKVARKYNIVAMPGGRRIHKTATPLMGGVSIYFGMFITCFLLYIYQTLVLKTPINSLFIYQILGVFVGATFISIMGVIDDKYELKGKIQLIVMILSGFILALFNVKISYMSNPFSNIVQLVALPTFIGIAITVIWTTVVTKAVDCIDGMDGLCAGFAVITAATFTIMAVAKTTVNAANPFLIPITASLTGASLGFLVYNFPPAKIFMGTIGSQLIGFTLASISIIGAYKITVLGILAPLLILGIPVADTTYVVLKRVSEGRKPNDADKTHIHHRLKDTGKSVRNVILTIYMLTAILCFVALYIFFTEG